VVGGANIGMHGGANCPDTKKEAARTEEGKTAVAYSSVLGTFILSVVVLTDEEERGKDVVGHHACQEAVC
jgi:hypothetical protein